MKILIILVDFLSSWKNSVTESVCGIHHWPRIRHFGLCCELFVFNWNSGSVRGLHEDFHVYLYTDSKKSAHTIPYTVDPNSAFYCILHKTAFKSSLGYTFVKLNLKFTFQSINKYPSLQMNKIQSNTYEKLSDEAEQRTLSLLLLIETWVQMFSPDCLFAVLLFRSWVTICFLSLYDTALALHESFWVSFWYDGKRGMKETLIWTRGRGAWMNNIIVVKQCDSSL